jgi:uncharacterized protein with HEPN domain
MTRRVIFRLQDIVDAIDDISSLLADKVFLDIVTDRVTRAAFERFVEILSEASRHIPQELKDTEPLMSWNNIADIGNHLRHAYHRANLEILWNIHADGLFSQLRAAVVRMTDSLKSGEP